MTQKKKICKTEQHRNSIQEMIIVTIQETTARIKRATMNKQTRPDLNKLMTMMEKCNRNKGRWSHENELYTRRKDLYRDHEKIPKNLEQ